jgi:hypothetical protein
MLGKLNKPYFDAIESFSIAIPSCINFLDIILVSCFSALDRCNTIYSLYIKYKLYKHIIVLIA